MTYHNLCEDLKTCMKEYKAMSKSEKESDKGMELHERIWDIKEQLQEMENSLKSFHIVGHEL